MTRSNISHATSPRPPVREIKPAAPRPIYTLLRPYKLEDTGLVSGSAEIHLSACRQFVCLTVETSDSRTLEAHETRSEFIPVASFLDLLYDALRHNDHNDDHVLDF